MTLTTCFLFCVTVCAEVKVGGYNLSNVKTFFDTNDVVSYGKVVVAKVNSDNLESNSSTKYKSNIDYIYFCGFKELFEYGSTWTYYKNNGEFEKSVTKKSSNETFPISLEKNTDFLHKIKGTQLLVQYLDKKCSNENKKFPRIEIPFVRGVSIIDHILFDTLVINKNLRSAWVKRSYTLSEKMLDGNNKPIQIDGSDYVEYTIDKNKGTKMTNLLIDCDKNTIGTKETIEYSVKGDVVSSSKVTSKTLEMDTIVPNTVGEITRDFFCKI